MSNQLSTRLIAGVPVPNTPLITKALSLAEKQMDPIGYRHVVRSWIIGNLIISRLPPTQRSAIDLEAFSIAAILHDLGWSHNPELRSHDKCFEVDGANAARTFLLREADGKEWDKHRIQLVWDSIALHTYALVAAHKEPEVSLINLGISVELLGAEFGKQSAGQALVQVSQEELDGISREFPRTGLKGHIKELMCGFCRDKPDVTYWSWVGGFGERYVEGYSSEGKIAVDLLMGGVKE
ncbi:hypothetical protein K458DRAFT_304722 [Lentithecium fluviatile CBS 122367]|uniref:HD domain-containing protein n=1 Tax=Lentithecium fluviatile CBS 122367 TaxID=1168545 RepID=A0A6G1J0Y6_9PLEO|nr:hypothetical protein K458DRAFT_304722 [Lentithecium fluviatile CBS 122367]